MGDNNLVSPETVAKIKEDPYSKEKISLELSPGDKIEFEKIVEDCSAMLEQMKEERQCADPVLEPRPGFSLEPGPGFSLEPDPGFSLEPGPGFSLEPGPGFSLEP